MPTETKYPTANTNTGTWSNPTNAYVKNETPTPLCTTKTVRKGETKLCYFSGYGFSIPAGSTITKLTIGMKSWLKMNNPNYGNLTFRIKKGSTTYSVGYGGTSYVGSCGNTIDKLQDITGFLTVEDLNTENFSTWLQGECISGSPESAYCFVDAVWITVEYLAPSGWRKLQYTIEPPSVGFNQLKFASEPPVSGAWNKLLFEGE